MHLKILSSGQIVFYQGDVGDRLYIILEGQVNIYVKTLKAKADDEDQQDFDDLNSREDEEEHVGNDQNHSEHGSCMIGFFDGALSTETRAQHTAFKLISIWIVFCALEKRCGNILVSGSAPVT